MYTYNSKKKKLQKHTSIKLNKQHPQHILITKDTFSLFRQKKKCFVGWKMENMRKCFRLEHKSFNEMPERRDE